MASFAPRPGCPLCSIVSTPYPSLLHSPRSPSFFGEGNPRGSPPAAAPPQIVHKDDKITVYVERNHPVSSKGHLVVVLNLHVPSLYMLSSSDLPLLLHIQQVSQTLLTRQVNGTLAVGGSISPSQNPSSPSSQTITFAPETDPAHKFNIGFIVSPFSDPKIPVSDHVHCHAYVGTLDKAGWWRKLNYSGMGWWAIDDLIAEIREQASNNRVKSAYPDRQSAPINRVPDAGAKTGLPNGVELPQASVGLGPSPASPTSPPVRVPSVAVSADDDAPITPKVAAAEEGRNYFEDEGLVSSSSSGALNRLGSGQLKRPMGPRTKDSGSSGNIPLSQVSGSSSPEPVPAP